MTSSDGIRATTVGFDGSEASASALAWALANGQIGDTIDLITVYAAKPGESPDEARVRAQAILDQGLETASDPLSRVIGTLIIGEPVEVLLQRGQTSRLIVVGRHGTRGMIHSSLGSVGEACTRLAECPVVIVPPRQQETD